MSGELIEKISHVFERAKHEALALVLAEVSRGETPEADGQKMRTEVEPLVSVQRASEHLGVTARQLRQMVADEYRNIPYHRVSERGIRFKLSELDEWSRANARAGRLKKLNEPERPPLKARPDLD